MSASRRSPSHRQEQLLGAVTAIKPTSPPPGRDVKGALIKAASALPHLIIAGLLWLVFIAALPPTIGVGVTVLGASVLALLAVGVAEGLAVRILLAARRPTPEAARRLVVPLRLVADWVDVSGIQLRVVAHGRPVDAAGRRQILVAQEVVDAYLAGRMTDGDMAALILHGIGRLRCGRTRLDLAGLLWTVPWDLVCRIVVGTARLLAWIPLGRFAWHTRAIVGAISVVLETQAGRWQSAFTIAAFMALTYLIPYWGCALERHVAERANLFVSERSAAIGQVTRHLPPEVRTPAFPFPSASTGSAAARGRDWARTVIFIRSTAYARVGVRDGHTKNP